MPKPPTKKEFRDLLQQEIAAWNERAEILSGVLKEQSIGRRDQCVWLLKVFEGRK